MIQCRVSLAFVLCAAMLAACSGPAPSSAQSVADPTPASTPGEHASVSPAPGHAAPAAKPTACSLVSADEMSKIFGSTLQAVANEGSADKTECIYSPAAGISPYIELTVEWGEGETAMRAVGSMSRAEPGIADPYAGIGDQAAAVGTALMIRTGEDLVTITFSGVDDAPAKARQIFATLKAKL